MKKFHADEMKRAGWTIDNHAHIAYTGERFGSPSFHHVYTELESAYRRWIKGIAIRCGAALDYGHDSLLEDIYRKAMAILDAPTSVTGRSRKGAAEMVDSGPYPVPLRVD